MADDATLKRNKAVVLRFNREVIERGDAAAFREIMATDFVNRTAPPEWTLRNSRPVLAFVTETPGVRPWVIDPEGNKVELWQPPVGQ